MAYLLDLEKIIKKNQIGAFQIPEDCLTELLEITSLLSDYAGYDE